MSIAGEVFYDAECSLCARGVKRWGGVFARRGFRWLPLQTHGAATRLGLEDDDLRAEMKLRGTDGRVIGGVDAWAVLFRSVWWLWPVGMMLCVPGIRALAAGVYRWVARNRYCFGGACDIDRPTTPTCKDTVRNTRGHLWFPGLLLALPALAGALTWHAPAWVLMWTLAFALFAACKWVTYWDAVNRGGPPGLMRTVAYLFAWPGMDARTFLHSNTKPGHSPARNWAWGVGNMLCGVALIRGVVPRWIDTHPLIAGWAGMAGVVLILHFGLFRLLAFMWQRLGIAARPVMRTPLKATSLAEFWGDRWNTAFHELAHRYTFRPFRRLAGVRPATLMVFALSGLMHDLLISLPARAGFGLPTFYFVVQGLGVLLERTTTARRIGLGRGLVGWLFTMGITAGPAIVLFHPWFIHKVILPFMRALGA